MPHKKATYLFVYYIYTYLDPDWDYSWFDPKSLEGFEEDIKGTLSKSDFYTEELINNIISVYRHQKDDLIKLANKKC